MQTIDLCQKLTCCSPGWTGGRILR